VLHAASAPTPADATANCRKRLRLTPLDEILENAEPPEL
jgi:hypothetical protein